MVVECILYLCWHFYYWFCEFQLWHCLV